jgi:outer membrane protein assembly factor BamA
VIRAVADAAERVDDILKGNLQNLGKSTVEKPDNLLTKKERAERRLERQADAEALETAATEVDAVLQYAPNNSLFGSSYHRTPFPMGLWVYNAYSGKTSGFGKWMFKTFAGEPVLVSTVNPDTRIKVATNALHNFGYFHGKVDYDIKKEKGNPKKAKINYYIKAGKVSRLDSIEYKGFPFVADSLIRHNKREAVLHKGDAFNVTNLTEEQSRLEKLFKNAGYYYYQASNATYKADTLMKPYKVQLIMQPKANLPAIVSRPWYMGHAYVTVYDHEGDSITKTKEMPGITFNYSGRKLPLHPIVWFQNIAHRPHSLYRLSDQENTQQMLSSLGIFSQLNIAYVRRDTTATCDTLDFMISAVLDKPYTSDFEMNVTSKNNDRIGPGLSWNLQRKNAFHGGELVNFKVYGSYEWRTHDESTTHNQFLNSYNVGTRLSLDFPRIFFPGISSRQFHFPTATSFILSADWLNRAGYFNLFSSGLSVAYSWHKNSTSKHELIPFSLSYDKLINSTHEFDSIMTANPSLFTSMRNRFVPSMQYTYTYMKSEAKRNPLWWQFSIKEAGNVTSGIYALAGKKLSEKNKNLFHNPFAQYVKLTTELHSTFRIRREYKFVTRLMAGVVYSYGNSDVAPYSDQFYVGGANSVRAFTIRTVGPGTYYAPHSKYSYMDQTGDLKLEGNVEFRFPIFGSLNGAFFLDAGNVWLLRENEQRPGGKFKLGSMLQDLAVGTGGGLRYDMGFLVLRLDLGVGIHDPANEHRSGYYNIGKFKDGLALHFAIGYPF